MFEKLFTIITRAPKTVLIIATGLLVFGGVYGFGVFSHLSQEQGFINKGSESNEVQKLIKNNFKQESSTAIVVFESKDNQKVSSVSYQQAVESILKPLSNNSNAKIVSFFTTAQPSFVSKDQTKTFATITLTKGSDDEKFALLQDFQNKTDQSSLKVSVGGQLVANQQATEQVKKDLETAELITLPLLAILLFFVFRSVVAGLLPLLLGVIAIVGAFAITRTLTLFMDIDQYALNVITILGLGLSVDYSLLMVNRFREELHHRDNVLEATKRTIMTAGRTIMFSGFTVMASLLALTIFPIGFLRSVGVGGISALAVAMLEALTILPAILFLLGHRIDKGHIGKKVPVHEQGPWWRNFALHVTKRPVLTLVASLAIIIVATLPLFGITFIGSDYRALPAGSSAREAANVLRADFANKSDPITVVYTPASNTSLTSSENSTVLEDIKTQLTNIAHVKMIAPPVIENNKALFSVYYDGDNNDAAVQSIVRSARSIETTTGNLMIGGEAAIFYDTVETIERLLPLALAIVGIAMFILLTLLLRSIIIPLQAIVINSLALLVSFSILVLVFQEGHLTGGFLGFVHMGGIDITLPILIFAIAFGLSMDYASFLYSRMREEYDRHQNNTEAIVNSLQRTGPVITAAALILFVVVVAFAMSKIALLQQVGLGLALAVLIDAFFVRLFLVPAVMKLFGKANWYAPKWLARFKIKHD